MMDRALKSTQDSFFSMLMAQVEESTPPRCEVDPVGRVQTPDLELELYFLVPDRVYELRTCGTLDLVKTITFPHTVQCV
jgi:hypothetical protein